MLQTTGCKLPEIINLGVFRGACPCRCVHCPVGLTTPPERASVFGRGALDVALFDRFCQEIEPLACTVRLHAVGEPTLHPGFRDLLGVVRGRGLVGRMWLFTCGLFAPALIPDLAQSIAIIEVSINSTGHEDYRQTKGVDAFGRVTANLERLQDRRVRLGSGARVVLTRVQGTPDSDAAFVEYWRLRGFECFVRSRHSYSGILGGGQAGPQESRVALPKCLVPWRRLNLDGTLVPGKIVAVDCFNVLFQRPERVPAACRMGTFPDDGFAELWNNVHFEKRRALLMAGAATSSPCDRCVECLTSEGPRAEDLVRRSERAC